MIQNKKTFLLLLLALAVTALTAFWLLMRPGTQSPASQETQTPLVRQTIPPPSVLTLPPKAPLPPVPKPPKKKERKGPTLIKIEREHRTIIPSPPPAQAPKKINIPGKWAIIKEFNQMIELDEKYYRIANESDKYGYKNQAITYYKKYLFVAPTGPHANEIRSRLAELESAF